MGKYCRAGQGTDNMGKYFIAGQGTDYNMAHAH